MGIRNQVSNGLFWIGDTSIFIAICSGFAAMSSYFAFGLETNWALVFFVSCATLFTYNLQRRIGLKPKVVLFLRSKIVLMIVGMLGMLLFLHRLSFGQALVFGILGILSILYAKPFIPKKGGAIPLRNIPFLKLWIIVLVWVIATNFMPLHIAGVDTKGWAAALFLFQQFFFITALTIPFDIRDFHIDDPNQKTFPMIFGVQKSLRMAMIFCFVSLAFGILNYSMGAYSTQVMFAFAISLTITWGVLQLKISNSKIYYTIFIDGLIIVQSILLGMAALN